MPQIDVRTKTMSRAALKCRALGHAMDDVAIPPRLRAEFHAKGQRLIRLVCLRGCSRWRELIVDMESNEIIGARGNYTEADSYLVQETGTGRLPKAAARAAYFVRVGERKDYRKPRK
jgi:hypothetical protein